MKAAHKIPDLVAILEHHGRNSGLCPSHAALAGELGFRSVSTITDMLVAAERRQLITIERDNQRRIITAADGSWSVASDLKGRAWKHGVISPKVRRIAPPTTLTPVALVRPKTCQFPLWGDERPGKNPKFCDAPVKPGSSWCPTCYTKVFDYVPKTALQGATL